MNINQIDTGFYNSLSVRAKNVLYNAEIYSLPELKTFMKNGGDLSTLRNCGNNTIKELTGLFGLDEIIGEATDESKISIEDYINQIRDSNTKSEVFCSTFYDLFSNLSVRSKNSLFKFYGSKKVDPFNFVHTTILQHFDFNHLYAVGRKTVKELNHFRENIISEINSCSNIELTSEQQLIFRLKKVLDTFEEEEDEINLIRQLQKKELHLLEFLERFVLFSSLFDNVRREILIMHLNFNSTQSLTDEFEIIGDRYGLTRERVRQISVKLISELGTKLNILKLVIPYSFNLNVHTNTTEYWKVENQPISRYSLQYLLNENNTFTNLLRYVIDDKHYILSMYDQLESQRGMYNHELYKSHRNLKVEYLVSSEHIQRTVLMNCINKVYSILVHKVTDPITLKQKDFYEIDSAEKFEFIQKIIRENFDLSTQEKCIRIERNTFHTLVELIEEHLIKEDQILTVKDIYNGLNNKWPGKCKSETSVRAMLQRDRFVYFRGSTGTGASKYGLKEWVKEKGLLSGSIKDICIDYLEQRDTPIHILELFRFISQHRTTTQHNLLGNLKLGTKGRFSFFKGGFIGLSSKEYNQEYINKLHPISPVYSSFVSDFMKNHLTYDYNALVAKFSNKFDLLPIQIEHLIEAKLDDGILKLNKEKVIYNLINEDQIINQIITHSISDINFSGYNPYRFEFEGLNGICKIHILPKKEFMVDSKKYRFHESDLKNSSFKIVLFYQQNSKNYAVIVSRPHFNLQEIENRTFSFSEKEDMLIENITEDSILLKFGSNKLHGFITTLKLIDSDNWEIKNYTNDFEGMNLEKIDVRGMNKLDAISHIIKIAENEKGILLELGKAREIYERIQLLHN